MCHSRVRVFRGAIAGALGAAMIAHANVSHAADLTDAQVIGIYIQVNGFDIETALLGRAQASSAAVRDLAHHVVADHSGVRQQAYELAQACGVSPSLPSPRDAAAIEHDKVMSALLGLGGGAFDRAYLTHEVAFHTAAIDAVKTVLLPSASCPQLKAHLTKVLPAFEHHLHETQALLAQSR